MKVLLLLADGKRTISVCLSENATVVTCALVGEPIDFICPIANAPRVLSAGYWEFMGQAADGIAGRVDILKPLKVIAAIEDYARAQESEVPRCR